MASAWCYVRMRECYRHGAWTTPHPGHKVFREGSVAEFGESLQRQRELLHHESVLPQYLWSARKSERYVLPVLHDILRYESLDNDYAQLAALPGYRRIAAYQLLQALAVPKLLHHAYPEHHRNHLRVDIRLFGYQI